MPRVHQQVARKDIYKRGSSVPCSRSKSGKRRDRSIPADAEDTVIIPKGSVYYKWTFRYGGTHRSLTRPKPSQLTQSAFLQQIYSWEESPIDCSQCPEDIKSDIDERVSEIETLRDETQDSLDNMPEQLQECHTGELLQERIDALDEMISQYEDIDAFLDSIDEIEAQLSDINYEGT